METHQIIANGQGPFEVAGGTKLVKAIEDHGIDISHRCGGLARCTTCRVRFLSAEPPMGELERDCLVEDGVFGEFRLSCQIRVEADANVEVLMLASDQGWEPGPEVDA